MTQKTPRSRSVTLIVFGLLLIVVSVTVGGFVLFASVITGSTGVPSNAQLDTWNTIAWTSGGAFCVGLILLLIGLAKNPRPHLNT